MICRRAIYLPAALLFALTACQRNSSATAGNPEFIQLEGERLSRAQREELLRMRYERLAGPHEEAVTLSHELESRRASVMVLRERKQALEQEVAALQDQKENLRHSALRAARERAIGQQMPELTLSNGRSLKQVTITGASEAGIQIRHATGTARLDVNDLGPVRSELYGLDPELQADAVAREESQRVAYERWVDRQLSAQAKTSGTTKPPRKRATLQNDLPPVSAISYASGTTSSGPLREKPRYFGGVRSRPRYVYHYYYYRPSTSPLITPTDRPSDSIFYPASSR